MVAFQLFMYLHISDFGMLCVSMTYHIQPHDTTPDPLYTALEACAYLRISRMTLHRLTRSGRITPVRVYNRCIRYRPEDLHRLVRRDAENS